jgi:HEAT repeat protein
MEKPTYAEHTGLLLADSRPDIVRSAVRSLQHLRWTPAVPALVALLAHKHPRVREAAAGALTAFGPDAVPALRHALGKARPDRRHIYSDVLKRLT